MNVVNKSGNLNRCSHAISQLVASPDQYVVAPHSIGSLFALLYLGARGETRNQLSKFFGLTDDSSIIAELKELDNIFSNDPATRNFFAFYARSDFPIEDEFSQLLRQFSDIRNVSFDEEDRADINVLVEKKTDGLVRNFISQPFNDDLVFLLLNTILCKFKFVTSFSRFRTKPGTFNCLDGSTINVNMMRNTFNDSIIYAESDLCQVIELACDKTKCTFGIILPRIDVPINQVQNLDPSQLPLNDQWIVELYLPKFTIEKQWDFSNLLTKAGLTNPFIHGADFTEINKSGRMYISMVIQKVKIEVDERGATAAAASAIAGREEGSEYKPNAKEVVMTCNRTFAGYIRINDKILFRFTYDGK